MNVKALLIIGSLVLLTVNCSPEPATQQTADTDHVHDNPRVSLFPEQPQVEQPLTILLELPSGVIPEDSQVAGINMNMGYMPLRWQQISPGLWQSEITLGACTEPVMQWLVTVPLTGRRDELPALYKFMFITDATVHGSSVP